MKIKQSLSKEEFRYLRALIGAEFFKLQGFLKISKNPILKKEFKVAERLNSKINENWSQA